MQEYREKMLKLLEEDAHLTVHQLATMLETSEESIAAEIAECEQSGILYGYKAIVDWEKVLPNKVVAMIEVRITPKRDTGFDDIARRVMAFEEVDSVYLMSGSYDLLICVSGETLQEVASFVSRRLSTIDGVLSTATRFLLKKYKENGVDFCGEEVSERRTLQL